MAQMVDAGYVAGSRSREAVTSFREEGTFGGHSGAPAPRERTPLTFGGHSGAPAPPPIVDL